MKKLLLRTSSAAMIVMLSVVFVARGANVSAVVPGINTLVSESMYGGFSTTGSADKAKISRFGEAVVFSSTASDMVASDTNGKSDVFVKDMKTNTVVRASVSSAGVEANDNSQLTAISSTGRFVAFSSEATNLIDGQTLSSTTRNYFHDTQTGVTEFINNQSYNAYMTITGISDDGRFLSVESVGGTVHAPGVVLNSSQWHIYRIDRSTGIWQLVDVPLGGAVYAANDYGTVAQESSMSCDGSFIAFQSNSTLLSPNDTNQSIDVFIADLRNGIEVTSLTEFTTGVAKDSKAPNISCDGRYVVFTGHSTDIVPGVTLPTKNYGYYYRYDRLTGAFDFINQSTAGAVSNYSGASHYGYKAATVSDYGDVAFFDKGTNLTAGYSGAYANFQIHLRRVDDGITETLSVNSTGITFQSSPIHLYADSFTADGKYAVIVMYDGTLLPNDTNSKSDVILVETGL